MHPFVSHLKNLKVWVAALTVIAALSTAIYKYSAQQKSAAPKIGEIVALNESGGWSMYQDERAVIDGETLIFGSVAGDTGNIEITSFHLATGKLTRSTLHAGLAANDHNAPAVFLRSDGRILALYAEHNASNRFYSRVSTKPHDIEAWQKETSFAAGSVGRVTYANMHWLADANGGKGQLYNFFRGANARYKPSWIKSNDEGLTWSKGGTLIDIPDTIQAPYVKYASNGKDSVHLFFNESHPREKDTSIYHAYWQNGEFFRSDGTSVAPNKDGAIQPEQATLIFAGDPDNVAWTHDVHLDASGHPYGVYSVQKNSAGLPPGQGGEDHRYRYTRWDGKQWHDVEIAYAGSRLYAGEDDYTGGICLHPDDPNTVFISTNVDPVTGKSLPSGHYELYHGTTSDGLVWRWSPLTENSTFDNLRPIVPPGGKGKTVLLWLQGEYPSYQGYNLRVVAQIVAPKHN